jgi:hypothetical protein
MAITWRAASHASGSTSASCSAPTGFTAGDILIAFKIDRATSGTTSAPSGWVRIGGTSSANYRIEVFCARYGDASLGTGPWSFSGTTRTVVTMSAYYNSTAGLTVSPNPGGIISYASNASGTYTCGTITSVINNSMIVLGGGTPSVASSQSFSSESTTAPGALTERDDYYYTSYAGIFSADGILATAGATGSGTFTPAVAGANDVALLALKPALAVSVVENVLCTETSAGGENVLIQNDRVSKSETVAIIESITFFFKQRWTSKTETVAITDVPTLKIAKKISVVDNVLCTETSAGGDNVLIKNNRVSVVDTINSQGLARLGDATEFSVERDRKSVV